jgi:hypothetical protein
MLNFEVPTRHSSFSVQHSSFSLQRFPDSSPMYGEAERVLGSARQDWASSAFRRRGHRPRAADWFGDWVDVEVDDDKDQWTDERSDAESWIDQVGGPDGPECGSGA